MSEKNSDLLYEKLWSNIINDVVVPEELRPERYAQKMGLHFPKNTSVSALKLQLENSEKNSASTIMSHKIEINAEIFLKAVSVDGLNGEDLLQLLGNSRIDKASYRKVESGNINAQELIDILDHSTLDENDYQKLILAAHRLSIYRKSLQEQQASTEALTQDNPQNDEWYKEIPDITLPKSMRAFDEENQPEFFNLTEDFDSSDDTSRKKNRAEKKAEKHRLKLEKRDADSVAPVQINSAIDEDKPLRQEKTELPENDIEGEKKYRTADDFIDDDEYFSGVNRGKMIAVMVMAIVLIISGMVFRYYFPTDSTSEKELSTSTTFVDSAELFERVSSLEIISPEVLSNELPYYSSGNLPSKPLLNNIADNEKYILYLVDNNIYVVEYIGGKTSIASVIKTENTPLGLFYSSGFFGVVSENRSYDVDVAYNTPIPLSDEEIREGAQQQFEQVEATLTRSKVTVSLYKSGSFNQPITYSQSGVFVDIAAENGVITLVTTDSVNEVNSQYCDESYLPSYTLSEQVFLAPQDCYIPLESVAANYLVVGEFAAENNAVTAFRAFGGGMSGFYKNGLAVLNFDEKCSIISNEDYQELSLSGRFINSHALDFRQNLLRAVTTSENFSQMYIADNNLALISTVENIAENYTLSGVCFDDNAVYMAVQSDNTYLYAINTVTPEDPIDIPTINVSVQNKPLIFTANDRGIIAYPNAAADGTRTGIALSEYVFSTSVKVNNTEIITAETSTPGDWNEYISTYCENNIYAMSYNSDNNYVAVPIKYFDGISEIEKVVVFEYNQIQGFEKLGEFVQFDLRSENLYTMIKGNILYMLFDDCIITANLTDFTIMNNLNLP